MKKIMIVDDDVTSVAIVKALLEPEFEVVSANTGVEALGELQRSPDLNLILLDMVMPGVSGMDLLKVLKKSQNWSNISMPYFKSNLRSALPHRIGLFFRRNRPVSLLMAIL